MNIKNKKIKNLISEIIMIPIIMFGFIVGIISIFTSKK